MRKCSKVQDIPKNHRQWWVLILAHTSSIIYVWHKTSVVPHWYRQPLACCDLQCDHVLCVLASILSVHHSLGALGSQAYNCRVMAQLYVSGLSPGTWGCESLSKEQCWCAMLATALTNIPFSQRPSLARLPICPSGWQGPAPCCCLDPRASRRAAGDPCSAAPDTAPPSPPRRNTTPARHNGDAFT